MCGTTMITSAKSCESWASLHRCQMDEQQNATNYELRPGGNRCCRSWKKKVAEGATVIYLDEVGFSLKGVRRRTWGVRGITPLVKLRANWEKLSTIGAITSDGRFFQHTKSGAIRSTDVIQFFQHLLRQVQGNIVVVLDNARIHHAKATQAFVGVHERLSLVFLPPYAPELNPIELVWAYVKRNVLGNFCAQSIQALKKKLRAGWQRVRYIQLPIQLMNANLGRYQ